MIRENQCILPYHLTLHERAGAPPRHIVDISCLADDTYMHGPATTLYTAYADKREAALAACELRSNLDKVAAWSPKGRRYTYTVCT